MDWPSRHVNGAAEQDGRTKMEKRIQKTLTFNGFEVNLDVAVEMPEDCDVQDLIGMTAADSRAGRVTVEDHQDWATEVVNSVKRRWGLSPEEELQAPMQVLLEHDTSPEILAKIKAMSQGDEASYRKTLGDWHLFKWVVKQAEDLERHARCGMEEVQELIDEGWFKQDAMDQIEWCRNVAIGMARDAERHALEGNAGTVWDIKDRLDGIDYTLSRSLEVRRESAGSPAEAKDWVAAD